MRVTNEELLFFKEDFSGPGGTEVNSRGRAALREAHGTEGYLIRP
jgi:hypothetical protein